MALTQAQQTTLKTDMTSASNAAALGAFIAAEDWPSVAAWYNGASAQTVWKPSVPIHDLNGGIVGSVFDALTVAKQNGYLAMTQGGVLDATQANVRGWMQDIFGAGPTLTNLTAIAQRTATRFELLFSTPAAPANVTTMFGVGVSPTDVQQAMLYG
jgi:hypothetical protein